MESKKLRKINVPVITKCNNNCLFCAAKHYSIKNLNLTYSQIKNILLKYKKNCNIVGFSGGEPTLLNSKLIKLIKFAKSIGYEGIEITTNGRLFSSKKYTQVFCQKLKKEKDNISITISIHGPNSSVHDYLTQTKGSFSQTIKGFKNLVANGFKVYTRSVITKQNFNLLSKMLKIFIKLGARESCFAYPILLGNALANFDLVVPKYTEIVPYIKDLLILKHNINFPVIIKGIPLCILDKFSRFQKDWKEKSSLEFKKCRVCEKCKLNKFCSGIDINYQRKNEDEVKKIFKN